MKALVIYDSVNGNTEKVAEAAAKGLRPFGPVEVKRAGGASPASLEGVSLLVIGSPTQGGRPLPAVKAFVGSLSAAALKTLKIAVFDTRLEARWVRIFGYAADKMAKELASGGADIVAPPAGFFVVGNKGPLKAGEEARAAAWAKNIAEGSSPAAG